jgi:hypothetical protein
MRDQLSLPPVDILVVEDEPAESTLLREALCAFTGRTTRAVLVNLAEESRLGEPQSGNRRDNTR